MAAPARSIPAPEALNRINDLVTRYCHSQMLFTACKLGIFESLAGGPATVVELATSLQFHPDAGMRLLIGLHQMGLLERDGDRFSNSPLGSYFTAAAEVPMGSMALWGALFGPTWNCLDSAVRENSPRWQQAFGASQSETFANLYKDPGALRAFCGLMSAYSIPQGQVLADAFDFTQYGCVLDVAGGPGGLIIEIGRRYPHLHGIVMDLPPVCALADEAIAQAGLAERYTSQAADLFAGPYPQGADAITLSWVLHDWDDENCRRILRNCHAALPSGGALLITESVLNDDRSGTAFGELMSLHMLLLCEPGARERTLAEYRKLLEDTGFTLERLARLDVPRDLIVAIKK
jgi:hypothetical protein